MARYEHLPIYKAAVDAAVHFDQVVAQAGHHLLTLLRSGHSVTLIRETGRLLNGVKEQVPRYRFQRREC